MSGPMMTAIPGRVRPAARPPRRVDAQERMARSIADAIADRRLPPGTKLTEERLAAIFGVSRARVRSVLSSLAQVGIVTLRPNRGAYVAQPTAREAREVFEARRIVERGIVERLARSVPRDAVDRLNRHIAEERKAAAAGDRAGLIRLSGDFHLLLGELAGNATLAEFLDALIRRSSLAIAAGPAAAGADCSSHEHHDIVEALVGGDAERAVRLMTEHLAAVEARLALGDEAPKIDLDAVFGVVKAWRVE